MILSVFIGYFNINVSPDMDFGGAKLTILEPDTITDLNNPYVEFKSADSISFLYLIIEYCSFDLVE